MDEEDEKKEYYESQSFVKFYQEPGALWTFNTAHGYLEALIRGFRSGFLSESEYRSIAQCDSLEDFKLCFQETDYMDILQTVDVDTRLSTQVVEDRIWSKFVEEFDHIRNQATGALATFIDYIQFEYMIRNVSFLINGLINQNDPIQLLAQCDELGRFPRMRSILTFENVDDGLYDLYRSVLIDTPIGVYFETFFNDTSSGDPDQSMDVFRRIFNEQDIDIIQNTITRYWIEDFYMYCKRLSGITGELMCELLEFQADKRAILIMLNSFGTALSDMTKQRERSQLLCHFGAFYPEGVDKMQHITDETALADVISGYSKYYAMWQEASRNSREGDIADAMQYELDKEEVRLMTLAFEQQSHFACFYAFVKLKERERSNLYWTAECIQQKRKESIFTKVIVPFSKAL